MIDLICLIAVFSVIAPLDPPRLPQFKQTKRAYDKFKQKKEFIIPTHHPDEVMAYLKKNKLDKDVKIISYELDKGFNVSKALNLGVANSKYGNIIITSPEVLPLTPVLDQLELCLGENIVCQVFDEDEHGDRSFSLVNDIFRSSTPAMYFLAMFNKADIEFINGWDEEFLKGYAYEDDDFGARWVRAQIPFKVREDIQAVHQYHPRLETVPGGTDINNRHYMENSANGVISCSNGLIKK